MKDVIFPLHLRQMSRSQTCKINIIFLVSLSDNIYFSFIKLDMSFDTNIKTFYKQYFQRRNSLLVARYSFQKQLVAKNHSLLVAEIAGCKKLLLTRCKISSFLVTEETHCKKSLVTCCKICSLLVAEVASSKTSFVTRCKNHTLLVAEVARCKKPLVTRCSRCKFQKITRYSLQNLLVARCRNL